MNCISFSIIIPVYNVEQYLSYCLDSVINQTYRSFEILLINDGSTDGSARICEKYSDEYSFIQYYSKKNGGLSSARNYGIKKAKGSFLLFIDSDDFISDKEFLMRVYNTIKQENIDLLLYLQKEYDENLSLRTNDFGPQLFPLYKILNSRDILDLLYSFDSPYITMAQTKIINRRFLLRNNLFFVDNIYHEDDEWIARVLLKYPNVILTDIYGYGYRHRTDSIISTNDETKIFTKCRDRIWIVDHLVHQPNALKYKAFITYFIYYYLHAFKTISKYPKYVNGFIKEANKYDVISAMMLSTRVKHRLLFVYGKMFGDNAANRLIMKLSN